MTNSAISMVPNLLMNVWSAAHLPSPRHQALLCCTGSSGECAFRESLQGQYTSDRHRSKGLCFYHITGTAGNAPFSRISMGQIGDAMDGLEGDLRIRVTSSTDQWQEGDLTGSDRLSALEIYDTNPLAPLTKIGVSFLAGCRSLTHIDLTPLSRIAAIPGTFLHGCGSLREVDLTPLTSVTEVGSYFLGDCRYVAGVDLTPLSRVTTLPSSFLLGCSSLRVVDFSPLSNVVEIGMFFMSNCVSLAHVNLAPLSRLSAIPPWFLNGCTSLTEVDLSPLSLVTDIGPNFMNGCTGLVTVNLQSLQSLRRVGRDPLLRCNKCARLSDVLEELRASGVEVV